MVTEPPDPHSGPTWSGYASGLTRFAVELAALVQQAAAAEVGGDPSDLAERLELLRAHLHQTVDKAIDAEAVRHPSPRRLIFRARHYFQESA